MRFAFKTSPQDPTWGVMLEVWREADDIELFESGWTSDHFCAIRHADPAGPCLERTLRTATAVLEPLAAALAG